VPDVYRRDRVEREQAGLRTLAGGDVPTVSLGGSAAAVCGAFLERLHPPMEVVERT